MVRATNNGLEGQRRRNLLLGVGLDGNDGHTRVTRGENFHLVGGSQDTHSQMQEQAIKFNEELEKRGRSLDKLGHDEFIDIAHETGMKILPDDLPPK